MSIGAATHTGMVRNHNEDCYLVEPEQGLYIVADGMGGHQAGEVASRIAVETIHKFLSDHGKDENPLPDKVLTDALSAAHRAIRETAKKDPSKRGMGTTVVIAWVPPSGEVIWVGHVGDSRAYVMRSGKMKQITEDHTVFNQAYRAGALPKDPKDWPPRQQLSQAVGASEWISPGITQEIVQEGDRIFLCTDGLTDMVTDEEISSRLSMPIPPQEICEGLVEAANSHGGRDNITVVVIQIGEYKGRLDESYDRTTVTGEVADGGSGSAC